MAEKYDKICSQALYFSGISFSFLLAKESGILATLLKADKPLTSEDIAKENNIRERYTREILGCLTSLELVRVASNEDGVFVYDLETPAKEALSKGQLLQWLGMVKVLMSKYKDIKDCLHVNNKPVSRYNQEFFGAFGELRDHSAGMINDAFLEKVLGLKEKLEKGIEVIEFGSGWAHCLSQLAAMFPASTFTATEVRQDLAEDLRKRHGHLTNMKFDVMDLCSLPQKPDKKYDWALTIDVIHDLPHPLEGLKGVRRMLTDDGVFTFLDHAGTGSHEKDAGDLSAAYFYAISTFLCLPESFQNEDSEGHGACWGKDTALGFAKTAGFDTSVVPVEGRTVLFIAKPV